MYLHVMYYVLNDNGVPRAKESQRFLAGAYLTAFHMFAIGWQAGDLTLISRPFLHDSTFDVDVDVDVHVDIRLTYSEPSELADDAPSD